MKINKNKRDIAVAVTIIVMLFLSAIANALICSNRLDELGALVGEIESGDIAAADRVSERFTKIALFISITVNHDDLEDAEVCVIEFQEAVNSEDDAALRLAKSRLISAIGHLKRLSGISIDSII